MATARKNVLHVKRKGSGVSSLFSLKDDAIRFTSVDHSYTPKDSDIVKVLNSHKLSEFTAIIVSDEWFVVHKPESEEQSILKEYFANGGHIIIVPSSAKNAASAPKGINAVLGTAWEFISDGAETLILRNALKQKMPKSLIEKTSVIENAKCFFYAVANREAVYSGVKKKDPEIHGNISDMKAKDLSFMSETAVATHRGKNGGRASIIGISMGEDRASILNALIQKFSTLGTRSVSVSALPDNVRDGDAESDAAPRVPSGRNRRNSKQESRGRNDKKPRESIDVRAEDSTPVLFASAIHCSGPGCNAPSTAHCAQCGLTAYCGEACQVAHWNSAHRHFCKALGELRQSQEALGDQMAVAPPPSASPETDRQEENRSSDTNENNKKTHRPGSSRHRAQRRFHKKKKAATTEAKA